MQLLNTILVSCTDNGQGVPQDYKEAVKWYRLAAEQGYAMLNTILVTCTIMAMAFLKTTKKL